MAKISKLTVSKVKQEYAKLNKMKTVSINLENGNTYTLDIRETITPTNIDAAFQTMAEYLDVLMNNEELDAAKVTGITTLYLYLCLIEQVTSLELPKEIGERIVVLNNFYDLDLLSKIIEKLDTEEIEKAEEKLQKLILNYGETIENARKTLVQAVEENAKREQVLWEADERIAQINELSYDDAGMIVDESEETKNNVIPMKKEDEADGAE